MRRIRLLCAVLFGLIAVSPLQAQDAVAAGLQPAANISDESVEPAISPATNEKIKFKLEKSFFPRTVKPRAKDWDFSPKRFVLPPKAGVDAEPERAALPPDLFPRGAKFDFPGKQTSAPPNQTSAPYVRPNPKERFKSYVNRAAGPYALLGNAIFAGVFQVRDLPGEWENNFKGYARRFGSATGIVAIRETVIYGFDEAFRLDSEIHKSRKKKLGARMWDVVVQTYTTRTSSGKRIIAFPRIIGVYTSTIVAYETWYPPRFGVKNALVDGTVGLSFDAGIHIIREILLK